MERIDEEHCNPLKIWESWGCPEELEIGQRQDMINATKMQREPMEYQFEHGYLAVQAELGVNDIYLITIVR